MKLLAIANKMGFSYDFYIKHNMHAVDWNLNAMIKKTKNFLKNIIEIGDTP